MGITLTAAGAELKSVKSWNILEDGAATVFPVQLVIKVELVPSINVAPKLSVAGKLLICPKTLTEVITNATVKSNFYS